MLTLSGKASYLMLVSQVRALLLCVSYTFFFFEGQLLCVVADSGSAGPGPHLAGWLWGTEGLVVTSFQGCPSIMGREFCLGNTSVYL